MVKMIVYKYVCLSSNYDKYAARLQVFYKQGSPDETWIEQVKGNTLGLKNEWLSYHLSNRK